ncbi:poly A polymerase C-terminal region-like protein [Aaosphaeria arxii CBS 175.79]|uniref:Poly A polymerase C-terminal region-like protein n=1 Tax=Aaosphaeria arxii CBS 175.79 TaxID=1450172 RepID=A0A6A5Y381_9PLEO|nr:poly A polymerase C-terminal region-like protein [Aaosphaeria arxii CBS 175.79]KAF2019908.1 poly A polymerase C-terminal region-like protein [Aaosphaeria arxii CBS 175.79]
MASQTDGNPTTIQLTETETRLRQLLLDVAAYIDENSGSGPLESAVKVPEELVQEKIVLRFTGGWVRDKLLGVGSHDIDVAINKMTGEHFGLKILEYLEIPGNAEKYGLEPKEETKEKAKGSPKEQTNAKGGGEKKSRKIAPGLHKIEANPEKSKNLETATTNIMGLDIDLVNLRKETYNEVSRNPVVEFGTPEEDAMRRDATINAMFFNLNTSRIEDFTGGGFNDLAAKVIRTPLEPYQTFKDDPLRVLRLIRFASRLNYVIDPKTEEAMSNQEIGEALKIKISRERVGIELEKMLKGPDPLMALELIDRLKLYATIFTDPTRELAPTPDTEYFRRAYLFVNSLLREPGADIPDIIAKSLVRDKEEEYLAWICAAVMPWADAPTVPHQKPTQKPYYAAHLVAREGFKAPNKVSDTITASLRDGEEIRKLIDLCATQLRRSNAGKADVNATARDTLGMAIRRWGPAWRTQVLFSMLYEIVLESISRESILKSYALFLQQVSDYSLLDAYNFKPLITGTELAKALNTKPGPWMKDALDVVMAWQLRNPEVKDPTEAIEAVKTTRNSELSSRLASHFLTLTVRPLFSQAKTANPTLTAAGHKAPSRDTRGKSKSPDDTSNEPWKDDRNYFVIELLRWSITSLDGKGLETNWGLIVPPILKMTDDIEIEWKATGCELLTRLLQRTPSPLLSRTGLGSVFEETLLPLFTYIPTLTPEPSSQALLSQVHPALLALTNVMHPPSPSSPQSTPRTTALSKILRTGILSPLFHAPPTAHPRLAQTLLSHLPPLLAAMGISSTTHLQPLTALLSDVLAEPLGLAYPPLMVTAARCYLRVMENAWPRVGLHRGEIMRGVAFAWIRCVEDDGKTGEVEELKGALREVVEMLEAVVRVEEGGLWDVWVEEKKGLVEADERLRGLFGIE